MTTFGGDNRTVQLPSNLQAGKEAMHVLVKAVGGTTEAARISKKSQPRISTYCLKNTADFAPVDVVRNLEAVSHGCLGHPPVTRWLADEAGYLLVKKPEALPSDADWCEALAEAGKEFNDVQQALLRAMPNGVREDELRAANIRTQIAEAQERLALLDALAARALGES